SADSRLPSRAFVYDMRKYVEETKWGPWLSGEDGSINWMHLWHLIDVLRHNAHERASDDIPNTSIEYLRAHSAPKSEDEPENQWNDWAGVQGIWLRAVSFMDYRDLHAYNFSSTSNGAYSTAIFENANFAEAFRLIKSYFTITKMDEVGPPGYPHRPTIYFVGDTALPNHPTDLGTHRITKGSVCMTKSVGGHSWASEGVQLGNVQSRAGVVGVWSSADHEDGDPAGKETALYQKIWLVLNSTTGPFWLWKSSE
ncbi:6070_t:CDS:2, partial [Acaulospora colombiana]